MPTDIEFHRVRIPETPDAPDAGDFRRTVELHNVIWREISGHDDHSQTPAEMLAGLRPDPDEERMLWLVLDGDRAVGRLGARIPNEAGARSAYVFIELVRAAWGRGIGSAAQALLERTVRGAGRAVMQTWAEHPDAPGDRLAPPTGFGTVPHDHAARFLERHGYSLEQVVRMSVYDLASPPADLDALLAAAETAAGGYRVVQWELPTPDAFVDGYAWMKSRMSTDAPDAGMESPEEVWDGDRLRRRERASLDAGRRMLVTAAQHVASGELCAFNELTIGTDETAATHQDDTLVLAAHRGHRLGMLVKAAGLRTWRTMFPASPRVLTYNAEENRPMLDINEALGFEPRTYEGAWKKVLSP